ncbi:MAG TPA: DUF309 domain-containing protein [Acidobacteriaceae bacterium]|nr:DUF309 domain-containing protein [Acidobacteriaceae bacterium]
MTPRMEFDWNQGALAEGLRLYRAGEYFRAHEEWESVWLAAGEPEKRFLQGLIQVTAAFHHWQRQNPRGTSLLLEAALLRIESYPESFGGLSVVALCGGIRASLNALETGEEPACVPIEPRRQDAPAV